MISSPNLKDAKKREKFSRFETEANCTNWSNQLLWIDIRVIRSIHEMFFIAGEITKDFAHIFLLINLSSYNTIHTLSSFRFNQAINKFIIPNNSPKIQFARRTIVSADDSLQFHKLQQHAGWLRHIDRKERREGRKKRGKNSLRRSDVVFSFNAASWNYGAREAVRGKKSRFLMANANKSWEIFNCMS